MAAQLLKGLKYEDSESIVPERNRVHADVCPTRRAKLGGEGSVKSKISLMTVSSQFRSDGGPHDFRFIWLELSASRTH